MTLSLEDAFSSAQQTKLNRRLLVALIDQADTRWWGGHVDNWQPDEALFSSGAALKGYRKLVTRFKKGETAKSAEEAQQLLDDTLEEIRARTSD